MTYQQRTTHFLGRSIGFLQKVFKLHPKKQKSNPTLSEESSKTLPKIPSQDSVYRLATYDHLAFGDYDGYEETYKEAAKADSYLFGDYNAYEAYGDIPD